MMNIQDQITCSTTRRSLLGRFWSVSAAVGASVIATRRSTTINALASAAVACSFFLTTYASASPTLEEANPRHAAQVRDVCRTVMGYTPIEVEYRACVDSLIQSLAGTDKSDLVQRDRQACAQAGNLQGTPAFALCVF